MVSGGAYLSDGVITYDSFPSQYVCMYVHMILTNLFLHFRAIYVVYVCMYLL